MRLEPYSFATGRATGLMICVGYSYLNDADLELLRALRPTHVSFGIGLPLVAEDTWRWSWTKRHRASRDKLVRALGADKVERGCQVWMVPGEVFVDQAAEAVGEAWGRWGTTFDYPNPEQPWRGETQEAALERWRKRGRHQKVERLVLADAADHDGLARRYVEGVRQKAPGVKIWPVVVGPGHPRMRAFVEHGDGACHQMMAFHNERGHQTEKPPARQKKAWGRIHKVWAHKGEGHAKWSQHALYHQRWPGQRVPLEVMACRSIDASLACAKGDHERLISVWDWSWIKRQPWAARVAYTYSPRREERRVMGVGVDLKVRAEEPRAGEFPDMSSDAAGGGVVAEPDVTLTHEDIRLAQVALRLLGYYDGPVDGDDGPVFGEALADFQGEIPALVTTGVLDPSTWGVIEQLVGAAHFPERVATTAGRWPSLPVSVLEQYDHLVEEVVARGVGYGPGRGWVTDDGVMVATIGPYGLGPRRYRSRDRVPTPAFVCSTWTYFVACYLLREGERFNNAMGGGQPPIWDVLMAPNRVHKTRKYGPYLGFAPFFERVESDGSSAGRYRKARGGLDMLEIWDRRGELPELMLCGQGSRRRGFIHHTAALRIDRERGIIRRCAADGSKSRGVFSGQDMGVEEIDSRKRAEAAAAGGWYQAYGLKAGPALDRRLRTHPRLALGFEMAPGQVEVVS